ncbi:MAG: PQQ-dependent sugar dehydrogenase [Myxococcota bacterium]|nr:PQQ-dependent sugar dehydrogenase [Myxococcota bacterium]
MSSPFARIALFTALAVVGTPGIACGGEPADPIPSAQASLPSATSCGGGRSFDDSSTHTFDETPIATLDEPWAMTFLPDGTLLVTEKGGDLHHVTTDGEVLDVSGVPEVAYGGQGGFGDVVLHPDFESNRLVYLSWAAPGSVGTRGAAVGRARLDLGPDGSGALVDLEVIWRQAEARGSGHYGHRLAFGPDGLLWISSGDRRKRDPAQDPDSNLGKILRLRDDGGVPDDNPFSARGGAGAEIWSLGHRNPLGIAFDPAGCLWAHEMGPAHGDELNRIRRGANYGWPEVSNGDHYNGDLIPDHDTRPDLQAPAAWWVPAISPAGFVIYDGALFPSWRGDGLIGGLSSRTIVRVRMVGDDARELERFEMGRRIRELEQGPDGSLYILEDGAGGRLVRLRPR